MQRMIGAVDVILKVEIVMLVQIDKKALRKET
jgi:hypothetical protein